jgi:hypothetical protein
MNKKQVKIALAIGGGALLAVARIWLACKILGHDDRLDRKGNTLFVTCNRCGRESIGVKIKD